MRKLKIIFAFSAWLAISYCSFAYADDMAAPMSGGTLTVITTPERAEVWIDGGYAGLSPIRDKQLTPGTYMLRLVDPARQKSLSETVTIVEGERLMVERSLEGSYGRLRVDTDPQGANVAIIADLGTTPIVNDYLTPGQYRLEIKHPDGKYLTGIKDVTFIDGQPLNISHTLEKPKFFTTKRIVQSALGAGAALCWTWVVIEQNIEADYRKKEYAALYNEDTKRANEMDKSAKSADLRGTIGIIAAAVLSVSLQVSIFIW